MGENLTVAEVLERAADLIEPEGAWMQGAFGSRSKGCYCAVGAIREALKTRTVIAEDWVDDNRQVIGMHAASLELWNDHPERTQAQVVTKLRQAAALARTKGDAA